LKEQFIQQVEREREQYKNVEFCFPWLEADDYPLLLGMFSFDLFSLSYFSNVRLC